jgi:hypothetical protein
MRWIAVLLIAAACHRRTTTTPSSLEGEGWKDKGEVFKNSYQEVLAALKHQDDKLGRALTAIAFLTAAGVALYTQIGTDSKLTFDSQSMPVTTFFFMAFVISIVLALGFILAAIGPSTTYRDPNQLYPVDRSLLFYSSIRTDKAWDKYMDESVGSLHERLARNFHYEAKNLSKRVHYKVARSREAGAFVYLAVLSLTLLGIFSVSPIHRDTRWWIASGVLLLISLLPVWDRWQMQHFEFPEAIPRESTYMWLSLAVASEGVLLWVGLEYEGQWWAVLYALSIVLISRLAFVREDFERFIPGMFVLGIALNILVFVK